MAQIEYKIIVSDDDGIVTRTLFKNGKETYMDRMGIDNYKELLKQGIEAILVIENLTFSITLCPNRSLYVGNLGASATHQNFFKSLEHDDEPA